MRTLLICHDDAALDREGLARWLGSFSTFAGTRRHPRAGRPAAQAHRARNQARRLAGGSSTCSRSASTHRLTQAAGDRRWEAARARPAARAVSRIARTRRRSSSSSPNSAEARGVHREQQPDLVIARCKTLLSERIFSIPRARHLRHAPRHLPRVPQRARLLLGDGHRRSRQRRHDAAADRQRRRYRPGVRLLPRRRRPRESHVVTQHRVVLDHLDAIRDKLLEIEAGTATPIDTTGRKSAAWGQPWLSACAARCARTRHAKSTSSQRSPKSTADERADVSRRRRRGRRGRQRLSRAATPRCTRSRRSVRRASRRDRVATLPAPARPHLPDPPRDHLRRWRRERDAGGGRCSSGTG